MRYRVRIVYMLLVQYWMKRRDNFPRLSRDLYLGFTSHSTVLLSSRDYRPPARFSNTFIHADVGVEVIPL